MEAIRDHLISSAWYSTMEPMGSPGMLPTPSGFSIKGRNLANPIPHSQNIAISSVHIKAQ